MTTQTEFRSWQEHPKQPDPKTCAPICKSWMSYLTERWGGQNLGCYNSRPVVGGSALSSHGSGAATDWRYSNPGPGRAVLVAEVLPFLIDNSLELGIQAIHDYAGCRIWRPPGHSGRPGSPAPECGWKVQSPGPQMGQAWATWIHLECLPARWDDGRSVFEMLGARPIPPSPAPEPEPAAFDVALAGDDDTMFVCENDKGYVFVGNGIAYRQVPAAEVDKLIARFKSAENPLRDLYTGKVVGTRADVGEADQTIMGIRVGMSSGGDNQ